MIRKFEKNDIITKIDGNEVKNLAYLRYYLYQHKVGDTIKVTVYRDGKTKELSVTLGTNKQTTQFAYLTFWRVYEIKKICGIFN